MSDADWIEYVEYMVTWVNPFYGRIMGFVNKTVDEKASLAKDIQATLSKIDTLILERMLSDNNWRPRLAAACFIGLGKYADYTDKLGSNLLEHPRHAYMYCFALARIGTTAAQEHLIAYLMRYLIVKEAQNYYAETLSVDWALSALKRLDNQHQTNYFDTFYPDLWNQFLQANIDFYPSQFAPHDMLRQRWNLETAEKSLAKWMTFAKDYFD